MDEFKIPVNVRWSDLDPNFHIRHSVYYDYGAFCRIEFLATNGITVPFMQKEGFGPVIFREECVFKKELQVADLVTIDLRLLKAKRDGSRWTMQHRIFKNDEIVAAVLTLDGAWMNVHQRKLMIPPPEIQATFQSGPKPDDFAWSD